MTIYLWFKVFLIIVLLMIIVVRLRIKPDKHKEFKYNSKDEDRFLDE